ncbi:MAG: glycosyltransferase family 4 protein [Sedimenticola sp.]
MRILIVTQYYWPENFRINDLVTDLVRRGHQVTVLTGVPNYPSGVVHAGFSRSPSEYSAHEGADIVRVPMVTRGKGGLQLVLNYISFALAASTVGAYRLRKHDFDSVFVFEPSPITVGLPAVLLRRLKKAPLIFWVLDLWPDTLQAIGVVRSKFILGVVGKLVSFIYKRCDLVLGQSKSFLSHIRNYSGHDRVEYFPGWAESVFQNGQVGLAKPKSAQCQLNVMFAGNVGEAQDFPAILAAAELLKDDSSIHWTIVGDGRLSEWLENEVNQRGLSRSLTLAGRHPVEKMPEFFQQADTLLVSLKDEPIFSMTIPGKLQAYLMAGKPILAMLNGEGARIVTESGCGLACDAGNGQCLADAVLKLMQMSDEERQVMGDRGRELSVREFDRDMLISRLENWMVQLSKDNVVK